MPLSVDGVVGDNYDPMCANTFNNVEIEEVTYTAPQNEKYTTYKVTFDLN